ncbi:hypothetical protein FORC087_347 (plasmid) [Bacillus cereus]|nr:hypothetical protein FORC087_347 [Bacillus cereus]
MKVILHVDWLILNSLVWKWAFRGFSEYKHNTQIGLKLFST